jgi:predicted phosphohydrolase
VVRALVVADEVVEQLYDVSVRRYRPDLVLAAGDLPWAYLEFLSSALDVPIVFVPGNHDAAIPSVRRGLGGGLTAAGLPCDAPRPHGCLNADGRVLDVAGLRIAGLGGCVRYNDGPHQYTQKQYRRRARRLVRQVARAGGDVDVLLTHAPPLGLGDEPDPCHVGVEAMHEVLADVEPTWQLHGHVHPYGHPRPDRAVGRTTIRNVVTWTLMDITPRDAHVEMIHALRRVG